MTQQTYISNLTDSYHKLIDLGWRDIVYCPKNGQLFDVLLLGDPIIRSCFYWGRWPHGEWVFPDYPDLTIDCSKLILFKPKDRDREG